MSDEIVNARNLNTSAYKERDEGPRFRVFRESDFNFIIDECETVCGADSPFKEKGLKAGKTVLASTFLEKTHSELKDGVSLTWSEGEKLKNMLEQIGVRALRDYKYMTILLELVRIHYAENRGEVQSNEI